MVKLREIPRTAAFAWSQGTARPLLVTGTRAGAVDADFSDETKLELWDLKLEDEQQGLELQPIASISADSRFFDIAWGPPNEDYPYGIIAGALENGSLDLWDAEGLIDGDDDAHISRTTKHTGAIKSLQFNPLRPQILATAGAKGELFIYDVNDISNPFRLGTAAAQDLECVAWNRKVPHILATGGSGGFVTVWDLKTKKASLTLNNSRKAVSAIAWDPNNSTKLLTATPDDTMPVIFLWDLRNSNAPERTLQGHEQGVLSVSWCQQDSDILISCGKDNRTIVWNPQTGERYGEFPEVTNWTFLTRFNPSNPNLSATASFDGKIAIQTLQNTNPTATQAAAQNNLDGEDFFTKAQTQPQGASFTLTKAPTWYQRPIGASFGFGGKVVVYKAKQTAPGQPRSSEVTISHFAVDSEVGTATEKFEEALKAGDLKAICESHREEAKTEQETADWKLMETLVAENPRKQVIEYLGLSVEEEEDAAPESQGEDAVEDADETAAPAPKESFKRHKKNRLSTFFADGAEGDDFLAGLAATKGAKTESPFHLLREGNTSLEDSVTKAIMLGNFTKAVEICIKADRIADAFLIANCGGKELVDQVQTAYIGQKKGTPSYLRLLGSVINQNLWDVVYNADLADWKETMATLCTFAKPEEFPDLCEALGDRIFESGSHQDASFCYLVGSKLEKVVDIWIAALEESEQAEVKEESGDNTFSVHARALQQLIEKVTVFRQVTKFEDSETSKTSGWKLAALYDKYTEYADIVAAHGQLAVAQRYLSLVPAAYPAAEVARTRLQLATGQSQAKPAAARAQAPAARASSRQAPVGYQPPQPAAPQNPYGAPGPAPSQTPYGTPTPAAPAANLYAPSASPYAPSGASPYQPNSAYAPPQQNSAYAPQQTSAYAPAQQTGGGYAPPAVGYGQPQPAYGAPPPRNATPSAGAPPRIVKDVGTWNDVPMVTKAPPPRRSTPSVAPVTAPFGGQQQGQVLPPPPQSPYLDQRGAATPPPPPPKAGAAPPRVTSPLVSSPPSAHALNRPPSTATSSYAPPPAGPGMAMHPHPPRTASPYSAAASTAPPSNRYAPAPAAQQPQYGAPAGNSAPPPPAMNRPPPANPYAPAPQQPSAAPPGHQAGYAPSPYNAGMPQGGPPPVGPPPGANAGPPPGAASTPTPPPPRAGAPPKAKHPAGDRSHIPAAAQPLVDIFSRDMQRVAAKAPASFAPQVKDTQKRLNILFDHLNNEELIRPETIGQLAQIAAAIESKDYDGAHRLQVQIQTEKTDECGQWMVRMIDTPSIMRTVEMVTDRCPHRSASSASLA
ncbi:hypothetical protein RB597_006072 [Gaeumannomyces tritici]